MFELHHLSAQEQWEWLQRGEVTPRQLVDHYLARIEHFDGGREDGIGAFVTVTADAARERADSLDLPRTAALWGLPFADKDLIDRAGVPTGHGSRLLHGRVPTESHPLVTALDAAGAISLGKTNAPEFGMPSYTESLVAPPARNPWNLSLGAGGSSGGAAVAVAAGLLPFAPGSDGGGSIRIPAAACGLVGIKPSRGLVPSGSGLQSVGGLVVPGAIARSVADAAMLLDAMLEGGDYEFTVRAPHRDDGPLLSSAVRGEGRFQLGVMTTSPWDGDHDIRISPEATDALDVAVREFVAMGHGMEHLALTPDPTYAPNFLVVWQAGASMLPVGDDGFDLLEPLTRWLVHGGRALSARALAEAQLALVEYERSVIRQFASFDAVLTPALAMTPRPIGWYDPVDAERNFAQQVQYTPFTSFANVTGLPAITLPVHETSEGLPMGVQLVGRHGADETLLSLAAQLEAEHPWTDRHPGEAA
ncbi:MAG: amidase [Microbacteriaceae bacterium]|nr:amidase [Microbacteriaceae bacterium]